MYMKVKERCADASCSASGVERCSFTVTGLHYLLVRTANTSAPLSYPRYKLIEGTTHFFYDGRGNKMAKASSFLFIFDRSSSTCLLLRPSPDCKLILGKFSRCFYMLLSVVMDTHQNKRLKKSATITTSAALSDSEVWHLKAWGNAFK